MFKKLVSFTLLSAFATLAIADEASVKKAVEAAYPKFKASASSSMATRLPAALAYW